MLKTALRDSLTDEQMEKLSRADVNGHGCWSHAEMISATIADRLGILIWQNAGKGKPPEPIRRPGVKTGKRQVSAKGVAYLEDLRRKHRERQQGGT